MTYRLLFKVLSSATFYNNGYFHIIFIDSQRNTSMNGTDWLTGWLVGDYVIKTLIDYPCGGSCLYLCGFLACHRIKVLSLDQFDWKDCWHGNSENKLNINWINWCELCDFCFNDYDFFFFIAFCFLILSIFSFDRI